jgi:hypothetical protein
MGSSNDDMTSQKQNISIGNATRILNEHPIHLMFLQEPYAAKIKNKNEYKIPETANLTTASVKHE